MGERSEIHFMMFFISELLSALLQICLFSVIPFLWWLVSARKENFFHWLGFSKPESNVSLRHTIMLTVLATAAYGILTTLFINGFSDGITQAGSQFAGKGVRAIPAVLLYAYMQTGLSEELLFRGFLLKRIASRSGFYVGNTIQALLFGAVHGIPFGIITGSLTVTVILTVLPGAFGWFEGWLNEKRFGGSILPCWLLHGTINLIAACSTVSKQ